MIIDCPKIGPGIAINILSQISAGQFLEIISSHNEEALSSINGIGPKKAEQIIVTLKSKVAKLLTSGQIKTDTQQDFLHLLDLYTNEYSKVSKENTGIKTKYPLAEDTDVIETYIHNLSDATDELNKRIDLRNRKRYVYKIESTVAPLTLGIGDIVKVTHDRFGFNFGEYGLIVGMHENPVEYRIDLEIWL